MKIAADANNITASHTLFNTPANIEAHPEKATITDIIRKIITFTKNLRFMILRKTALILLAMISALPLSARHTINFNKGWRFTNKPILDNNMAEITLPHSWNGDNKGVTYFGTGSYLKEITVPQEWAHDKRLYLRVGAASNTATLLVNGRYVGGHRGGFTSFTFDITPFINFGVSNSILLMVNNAPRTDVIPLPVDGSFYGGLYRDCELIVTGPNHIKMNDNGSDGVVIRPTSVSSSAAELEAEVSLEGNPGSDIDVKIEIYDPETNETVAAATSKATIGDKGDGRTVIPLSFGEPKLWNGRLDPFMYDVTVTTTDKDGVGDRLTSRLGLRTVGVDRNKGFLLNGRPYKLRGVVLHGDRSDVGVAVSHKAMEEDVRMILDMGANAIRLPDGPLDPYFYDLCDTYGLVVWSDLPLNSGDGHTGKGFIDSYSFKDNAIQQLEEMITQLDAHPSAVIWGIFGGLRTGGDNPLFFLKELNDYAKELSPDRLTVSSSIEDGAINEITDLISWDQYFGWKNGDIADYLKWADQFKSGWRNLMPGLSEYGAGGDIADQSDDTDVRASWPRHPESYQALFHEQYVDMIDKTPYFWGTFINSMFDYVRPRYNASDKAESDMGLVTFDRHTPKDAYYVYKALWSKEPFLHIAGRRNDKTSGTKRQIKVYTNAPDAELFVNGKSAGKRTANRGRAAWDITLTPGLNKISAKSGNLVDEISIHSFSDILDTHDTSAVKGKK